MLPLSSREILETLVNIYYFPDSHPDDKAIAVDFGIAPAAYSNYKTAKRQPDAKQAGIIAKCIAVHLWTRWKSNLPRLELLLEPLSLEIVDFSDKALERAIRDKLVGAVGVETERDLLRTLQKTKKGLRVSLLDYGAFCGSYSSFFNKLVRRYLSELGIEEDPDHITQRLRTRFNLEEDLQKKRVHLAACYFSSAARSLNARFYPTPIRISLGAVCDVRYLKQIEILANDVADPKFDRHIGDSKPVIYPIVVRGEVGYSYAIQRLEFIEDKSNEEKPALRVMKVVDELNLHVLRDELASLTQLAIDKGWSKVPVLIVDEYTALRLLSDSGQFLSVLPITTFRKNRESDLRIELPLFRVSFACSRSETGFGEFIQDSLQHFLTTEVQTTARAMTSLFWSLREDALKASEFLTYQGRDKNRDETLTPRERELIAHQFALYTLNLDRGSLEDTSTVAPEWRRILKRSEELIREELASDARLSHLQRYVKYVLEDKRQLRQTQVDQIETLEQVRELAEYTNLRLKLDDLRGLYAGDAIRFLRKRMRARERDDASPELRLSSFSPDQISPAQWEGIVRLLNQLGDMYRNLIDPVGVETGSGGTGGSDGASEPSRRIGNTIATRIQHAIKDRLRRYKQIIIVEVSPEGDRRNEVPAGILCILDEPGQGKDDSDGEGLAVIREGNDEAEILATSLEVRYIWVAQEYREHKVGKLLMGEAVRWCRRQRGCERIRAAILPQLDVAISLFHYFGFVRVLTPLSYDDQRTPNRLIFEHDTTKPWPPESKM